MSATAPPVVLVFAGSDPTGGAGITADVLTLASLGCHPAVVVTAVTAQDTTGIKQFTCTETELVIAQARAVLEDMPVAAFKIGMLGNSAVATAVAGIVEDYPDVPLILDPVQRSGRGDALADQRSCYAALATLANPVLILAASGDQIATPAHMRILCELLPEAQFCDIEGAEHALVLTHPEQVASHTVRFLR